MDRKIKEALDILSQLSSREIDEIVDYIPQKSLEMFTRILARYADKLNVNRR